MDTPTLLLGARMIGQGAGTLFRFGDSFEDSDEPILLKVRTAEVALAGVGGRVAFQRLFVAVTFTVPWQLRVTPIIDGKVASEYAEIGISDADYDDPTLGLDPERKARTTFLFDIGLTLPYSRGGTERFRYAMQGSYFQLEIEQTEGLEEPGELIIEGVEVEYKVLTKGAVQ